MTIVTNPRSVTAHASSRGPYYSETACGLDCTSWPSARDLRPLRFCARCFSDRERGLLTDLLPELTEGDAK